MPSLKHMKTVSPNPNRDSSDFGVHISQVTPTRGSTEREDWRQGRHYRDAW